MCLLLSCSLGTRPGFRFLPAWRTSSLARSLASHRVYKNYDPRAKIMRRVTAEVIDRLEIENPLLTIAMALEKAALADPYFVSRSLYPNVDFYSGITLCALGIPLEMYTVIFTIARVVGWTSQWREFAQEPNSKITRPRQLYNGRVAR